MLNNKPKAVFNWSGGKDSALALLKIMQEREFEIISLLTTINNENQRSSMHAIPKRLLEKQAESIGLPLYIVELDPNGSMDNYETAMAKAVNHFLDKQITHFIFGDIFLNDVKEYREKQLAPYGIKVVEPLWGKASEKVMHEFISSGLKTIIITTMADVLDEHFIGRHVDHAFIEAIPQGVDICGENGEYHTFCYDGPIFRHPVSFSLGAPLKMSFPVKREDHSEKEYSYWFANIN